MKIMKPKEIQRDNKLQEQPLEEQWHREMLSTPEKSLCMQIGKVQDKEK